MDILIVVRRVFLASKGGRGHLDCSASGVISIARGQGDVWTVMRRVLLASQCGRGAISIVVRRVLLASLGGRGTS